MTVEDAVRGLCGGLLVGGSAGFLLVADGRVAGVSGVVSRAHTADGRWGLAFVAGLLAAGCVARLVAPGALAAEEVPLAAIAAAGLLVGLGTRLSNGCTSGHGVCGLSRGSLRSVAAVLTFLATGAATASLVGWSGR